MYASRARVARESISECDMHAVASVTQIPIYGIPTYGYVSFKLLIVYVFVPAVLLSVKARESLLHSIKSCAGRARVKSESSARECELVGGRHCINKYNYK